MPAEGVGDGSARCWHARKDSAPPLAVTHPRPCALQVNATPSVVIGSGTGGAPCTNVSIARGWAPDGSGATIVRCTTSKPPRPLAGPQPVFITVRPINLIK